MRHMQSKKYILVLLLSLPLFAQEFEKEPTTFQLGSRTYINQGGNWFHYDGSEVSAQISPSTLIVRHGNGNPLSDAALSSNNLSKLFDLPAGYTVASVYSFANSFAIAESMYQNGFYVEFDSQATFQATPNDSYYAQQIPWLGQWNLQNIGMPAAWDLTRGSYEVTVAISDSGVDYNHEDLVANIWVNVLEIDGNGIDDDHNGMIDDRIGWDFWNETNDPSPTSRPHGTHVAGIIGARANNSDGVAGIAGGWAAAQGIKLMCLESSQNTASLIRSVVYAAQNGARVVNMSWGSSLSEPYVEEIIEHLADSYNMTMVCSAGNSEADPVIYPARYDETIAVTSTDINDDRGENAMGPELDVAAPTLVPTTDVMGVPGMDPDLLEDEWIDADGVFSLNYRPLFGGTSASAPHVAGTVALMKSLNPGLTTEAARTILHNTADKTGGFNYNWDPNNPGHSLELGYGRIRTDLATASASNASAIQVLSPFGGETVPFGESIFIWWERNNFGDPVRINLYNDHGFVRTIADGISGDSYTWINPGDLTESHRYRIKVVGNSEVFDYSRRQFWVEGYGEVPIPDANFKSALIANGVDRNGDGIIDEGEAALIVTLDVSGHQISDLSGLEYFINLASLDCSNNQLTTLETITSTPFARGCRNRFLDMRNNPWSPTVEVCHFWNINFGTILGLVEAWPPNMIDCGGISSTPDCPQD